MSLIFAYAFYAAIMLVIEYYLILTGEGRVWCKRVMWFNWYTISTIVSVGVLSTGITYELFNRGILPL